MESSTLGVGSKRDKCLESQGCRSQEKVIIMNINRMHSTSDLLQKALDGTWKRNEALSQNIANVDTPGYQRKDVAFEGYLENYLKQYGNVSSDALQRIEPQMFTDRSINPYRLDGNNVDIDVEMGYLAENQIKGDALISQINYHYERLNMVLR